MSPRFYSNGIEKVLDTINSIEASSTSISTAITSCIIVRRKESGWFAGCGPITITVALSVAVAGSVWHTASINSVSVGRRATILLFEATVSTRGIGVALYQVKNLIVVVVRVLGFLRVGQV